jgi:hypothetical protein
MLLVVISLSSFHCQVSYCDMTEKSVVFGYLPVLGEAGGVGSVGGLASGAPDSMGTGGAVISSTVNS